jgi:hypothetical protein
MPAQKLFGLAKEAQAILAFCEEGLMLIGRHITARAATGASARGLLHDESDIEPETPQARMHRETVELTRAYAEEVRDPEIRRLLRSLADKYEKMAAPGSGHQQSTITLRD